MSDEPRGFRRLANGDVQLTMRQDDYDRLLTALGVATAAVARETDFFLTGDKIMGMLNRLCDGSPAFTPYQVSDRERNHPYKVLPA